MGEKLIIVEGVIKPDGTLEVTEKVPLPAGKVQVRVVPLPQLPADDPFWQRMQAIWDMQKAQGCVPRSVDEVEAERRAVREEWEERMEQIEKIQNSGQGGQQPMGQSE
jgi:hypothetical protein